MKLFSPPDDLEKLVVSGLKPFAKFSLRLLPVFGKGRFPDKVALAVAVPDPKNLSIIAFKYCTIMLGLAIAHLKSESCAEWLQLRFQKPDIATHHAEVGNLLSLYPKIHRLRADSKEDGSLLNGERDFVCNSSGGICAPAAEIEGEAIRIHTFLYGLL